VPGDGARAEQSEKPKAVEPDRRCGTVASQASERGEAGEAEQQPEGQQEKARPVAAECVEDEARVQLVEAFVPVSARPIGMPPKPMRADMKPSSNSFARE
jgi:hypothetical protein